MIHNAFRRRSSVRSFRMAIMWVSVIILGICTRGKGDGKLRRISSVISDSSACLTEKMVAFYCILKVIVKLKSAREGEKRWSEPLLKWRSFVSDRLLSRKSFISVAVNGWLLKRSCNIHSTRGNKNFTPSPGSLKKRKDMGQIYTIELNGQGFYLFMRGRPERKNNANPDEEIQLPCVWSGLVVNQSSCWHHVNRQCPDHIWRGLRGSEREGKEPRHTKCYGAALAV